MNGRHFKESTDFHERAILSMTAMTRLGEYLWCRPVDSVVVIEYKTSVKESYTKVTAERVSSKEHDWVYIY